MNVSQRVAVAGWALIVALGLVSAPVGAQSPCRNVAIRSPFSGEQVAGRVPVLGSARIDGFNFYKLEWARADAPEAWQAVSTTIAEPVLNGLLDTWDTTSLSDGLYRLKLTVVDTASQEPCRVTVNNLSLTNLTAPETEETPASPTVIARVVAPGTRPPAPESSASEPVGALDEAGDEAAETGAEAETGVEAAEDAALTEAEASSEEPSDAGEAGAVAPADEGADAESADAAVPDEAAEPPADEPSDDPISDALSPVTLVDAVGAASWPAAFVGGAIAALILAVFALLVYALRRSP